MIQIHALQRAGIDFGQRIYSSLDTRVGKIAVSVLLVIVCIFKLADKSQPRFLNRTFDVLFLFGSLCYFLTESNPYKRTLAKSILIVFGLLYVTLAARNFFLHRTKPNIPPLLQTIIQSIGENRITVTTSSQVGNLLEYLEDTSVNFPSFKDLSYLTFYNPHEFPYRFILKCENTIREKPFPIFLIGEFTSSDEVLLTHIIYTNGLLSMNQQFREKPLARIDRNTFLRIANGESFAFQKNNVKGKDF